MTIKNIDRQSPTSAAGVIAQLVPDPEARRGAIDSVADALEFAQKAGESWSVSLRPRKVSLTVGRILIVRLRAGGIEVAIDRRQVSSETMSRIQAVGQATDWDFRTLDYADGWRLPAKDLVKLWGELRPAVQSVITRAAKTRNPYLRADSPGVVRYLANESGRDLTVRGGDEDSEDGPRCWLFQSNPARYDLRGALALLDEFVWDVRQQASAMHTGDRVFLWESGSEGGLWAEVAIVADPAPLTEGPQEIPFVLDPQSFDPSALRVRLRVTRKRDAPLHRETVRRHVDLTDLPFFKTPRGTNFPLTPRQAHAFGELVGGTIPPRVVKIAPGEGGRYWDQCLREGYICVGWDEVGDLTQYPTKEEFRSAFLAAFFGVGKLYEHKPTATKKVNELWTLRELQVGDIIVANRGMSHVLGLGTVVEPVYQWRGDRAEYRHTIRLEWDLAHAGTIAKQPVWGLATVVDVPPDVFRHILEGDLDSDDEVVTELSGHLIVMPTGLERLRKALAEAELYYTDEQVSAYLAALQTRRFAILTGISGTGKTQLAMAVARVFGGRTLTESVPAEVQPDAHLVEVQPYMLNYARFVVPRAFAAEVESLLQASAGRNVLSAAYPGGTEQLTVYRDPSRDLTLVSFRGAFKRWFQGAFAAGESFTLRVDEDASVATFGKASQSGTRTRHVSTSVVVAVRPDWTDNRGLLGYYNPILDRYVSTPLLDLLLTARAEEEQAARGGGEKRTAYFVIFDEMNLARVEHYFSDFLSALESDEPIDLHDDDATESGEALHGPRVPKRLRIPKNVFITGTVNVDESTYMFSPKVLDRAFTIELNHVDLDAFGPKGPASRDDELCLDSLPDALTYEGRPSAEHYRELATVLGDALRAVVADLHALLADEGHPFGYRIAAEIARFVLLAQEQGADSEAELYAALDLAILMKVLPKFHGSQQELAPLLARLFAFAVSLDPKAPEDDAPVSKIDTHFWRRRGERLVPREDESDPARPRLPRCAAKLWRMQRRLDQRGFTSFIDG